MDVIKVEAEEGDYLSCNNSCFICLELVEPNNQEQLNSLNSLLYYLKIRNKIKSVVCEKCAHNVKKFEKLCNILEKVRLEMDYLLGLFKSAILESKGNLKPVSVEIISVRESVMIRCEEKKLNPRLEIPLQRMDPSQLIKIQGKHVASDCSDNFLPTCDDNDSMSSNSIHLDSPAAPVISEVEKVKEETKLERTGTATIPKRKRLHPYSKTTTKCAKCSKTFASRPVMLEHIKEVHLRLMPFKCSTCFKTFARKTKLRRHIDTVHLRIKRFKCDLCGMSFAEASALRIHKAKPRPCKDPNSKAFPCEECGKSFSALQNLKLHKSLHSEERFPCEICNKMIKGLNGLKKHFSSAHGQEQKQRHYCPVQGCDKTYSTSKNLTIHCRLAHPDFTLPFKPKLRGEDYSDRFEVVTENGKDVMQCKLCPVQLKNLNGIRQHLQVVHGPKKFVCEMCAYATASKSNLDQHIKQKHRTEEDKVNCACEICNKQFYSRTNLSQHHLAVHAPKRFVCEMCAYTTTLKTSLERHIRCKHKIKESVECEFCKKRFSSTYLTRHIHMVHGTKRFKCKECNYETSFKYLFTKHVKICVKTND